MSPVNDVRFNSFTDIKDINEHTLKEIEHFFLTYKSIEDKVVTISGIRDAKAAREVINEGLALYKKKFNT